MADDRDEVYAGLADHVASEIRELLAQVTEPERRAVLLSYFAGDDPPGGKEVT